MLLIVPFPTLEETRAAAEAGDERAVADLPSWEARESRQRLAEGSTLSSPGQLPDLAGGVVFLDWDLETQDGESWTVLRHEGIEIWRELAVFEGYERFREVFEVLRQRYGERLSCVAPTAASETYLYGDRLSAPAMVERLNASIKG